MKKYLLMIASTALLAGCTSGPPLYDNTPESVGELPENYQEIVTKLIKSNNFKDPYSVVIEVDKPSMAMCLVSGNIYTYAWKIPASYNAKNSFGAYTGVKPLTFWAKNGKIVYASKPLANQSFYYCGRPIDQSLFEPQ